MLPTAGPHGRGFCLAAEMNPSLECELARALMGRYLAGEEISAEPMRQLETHVKACAGCRAHLDEKRLELANGLSGLKPKKAAPWAKWTAAKQPKEVDGAKVFTKPQTSPLNVKTLSLSIGLAFVLFAMSAVAKDPTTLFGPKAAGTLPKAWTDPEAQEPETKPAGDAKDEEADGSHSAPKDPAVLDGSHAATTPSSQPSGPDDHGNHGHGQTETGPADPSAQQEPEPNPSAAHSPEPGHSAAGSHAGSKKEGHAEPAAHAEPEPKPAAKDSPKALLVAEEGKPTRVKAAPAPRPRAVPARRRASVRTSKPARRTKPAPSRPRPSSGIKVYDSEGNLIR